MFRFLGRLACRRDMVVADPTFLVLVKWIHGLCLALDLFARDLK
jgi:hypothetical protein